MLNWHKRYSRAKLTMTAHSITGHTYTITSRGVTHPVNLHQQPGPNSKNQNMATVPTIELAILTAETLNLKNTNAAARVDADLHSTDQTSAAQRALQALQEEPKAHFLLEVPRSQAITLMETLPHIGLKATLSVQDPQAAMPLTPPISRIQIHTAQQAVNAHLQQLSETILLKDTPILGDPDNPQDWLDFLNQEYHWDEDTNITACLWQRRADTWPQTARRHRSLTNHRTWPKGFQDSSTDPDSGPTPITKTVMLEVTPHQQDALRQLTRREPEHVIPGTQHIFVNVQDDGPEILKAAASAYGIDEDHVPQWKSLSHGEQEAVAAIAAGVATWAIDGELHHEQISDAITDNPLLAQLFHKMRRLRN